MAINEYETEDQQVEALKKWWKENRSSLLVGLLVGVSAIFGWRYYTEQNNLHAVQASNLYMQLMQNTVQNAVDEKTIDINNTLINEYSDTPYAALSSLALAKIEYEKDNVDAAVAQLELAVKNASDEEIKQIANLRLASVYIEQEKYDAASALLNLQHDVAYDAKYEELKGDLHRAKGDIEQARLAYDKAISLYGASASKMLKLKRQNLGSSNPASSNLDSSASISNVSITSPADFANNLQKLT
jgi:predicted negative regulator of RcsB-dependent stress response